MRLLFADAQQQQEDFFEEMLVVVLIVIGVIMLVSLIIQLFYCLTLYKALGRCQPRNRTIEPGLVFLGLVPLLNLVWNFVNVINVSNSLQREFYDRGWEKRDEDYGRGVGMAFCILVVVSLIPYIGGCFGIGALICFIIYWVKVANYSSQLAAGDREYYDDRDRYDDRADDRDDRRDDDRGRSTRGDHDDGHEDRPWERR